MYVSKYKSGHVCICTSVFFCTSMDVISYVHFLVSLFMKQSVFLCPIFLSLCMYMCPQGLDCDNNQVNDNVIVFLAVFTIIWSVRLISVLLP